MQNKVEILPRADAPSIAYARSPGAAGHQGTDRHPGIVFLGGFMSDMSGIKATWIDIGVPAATWYNLWEFGPTVDRKRFVSAVVPQLGAEGNQVSTPPDYLHGAVGGLWNPPPGDIHFLQVRASSCDDQSGP